MKKLSLLTFVALLATSVAMAQNQVPTPSWGGDVLGAHNGYGRGCVMCHAPHGGATGNGATTSDPYNGYTALWGENLMPYYGTTFTFGGGGYPAALPATGATVSISDTNSIVLLCLSCHDGNLATVGMMQNKTVETLPVVGGNALTLFGKTPGNTGTMYNNEHPVGPGATVSCGGSHNWDCTGGGNTLQPISMNGKASAQFLIDNPSSFWNAETITACGGTGQPTCKNPTGGTNTWGYNSSGNPLSTPTGGTTVNAVTCTTCHNQHSMTVWTVGTTNYTSMFFVRGFYNPYTGGNNVAQFCRNCHGSGSNEMDGLTIPTT